MPHVIVKLLSGRSDTQKSKLADEITQAVMAGADCTEPAISVSIEDVRPGRWTEDVYKPDILGNWDKLHKKPGYEPF